MKQCNVDVNEFMIYIEHKMGYTKKQKISEELYLVPKISIE